MPRCCARVTCRLFWDCSRAVFGGGAFAGFLSHHMAPVIAFAAVYFVFALWLSQKLLSQARTTRPPGVRSVS